MLKGALILGIGFSLGYSKGLQDAQNVKGTLQELIEFLKRDLNERAAERREAEAVVVDPVASEPFSPTQTDPNKP